MAGTYTIGTAQTYGDFATAVAALILAIGGNIGGKGIHDLQPIGETFAENVDLTTGIAGCTASDHVDITVQGGATGGNEHNGISGAGATIQGQATGGTITVIIDNVYSQFTGIAITSVSNNAGNVFGVLRSGAIVGDWVMNRVLVYDLISTFAASACVAFYNFRGPAVAAGKKFINCVVANINGVGVGYGFYTRRTQSPHSFCVALNCKTQGFSTRDADATVVLKNCISGGVQAADFHNRVGNDHVQSYCASQDATAALYGGAATALINQHMTNDIKFINATAGTENPHIQAGSSVIGQGIDVAGITTDIDGDILLSPPNMGVDEIVAGGIVPIYNQMRRRA